MWNKRFWLSVVATWVVLQALEWGIHTQLLSSWYEATATAWRPVEEMMSLQPWSMLASFGFSFIFCWIFTKGWEDKGWMEGARYGLMIGSIFAVTMVGWWTVLPVPMELAVAWAVALVVEMTCMGTAVAWIWRPSKA